MSFLFPAVTDLPVLRCPEPAEESLPGVADRSVEMQSVSATFILKNITTTTKNNYFSICKLHQTMISAQFGTSSRWQYSHNTTNTSQSGPMSLFAVHIINPDDTAEINYIHKDHTSTSLSTGLGSWNTITDESGNKLQELSFDACSVKPVFCESSEAKTLVEPISAEARGREGNRRDPATWRAFVGTPPEPLFDRGFTGHEHLYAFNLINMNGRVYDPIVSRMLSPDNFIQAPGFSQSLNRYSYCWNNPLKYTDPSGQELGVENRNNWFWWEYRGGSNSSHSIGPGSGNHWSDQHRGEHGDFWLMNQRSFDNKYGDGAYLKGIELNKSSNIFNSLWKSGNIGTNSKVFLVKTTWLNFSGTTGNLNFTGLDYTYGVEIDNSAAANYGGQDGGGRNVGYALTGGGVLFGAGRNIVVNGDMWLGKNGKYYSKNWGGNQYTGSRAGAYKAAGLYKMAGRANVAATVVIGGVAVYNGYQLDGGQFGYHANSAGAAATGGLVGAWAGAEGGAMIGAAVGVWFWGVGAVPGAVIGGFVGGVVGGFTGSALGEGAVDYYYRRY